MQVQAYNRYSIEKYEEFTTALQLLDSVLEEIRGLLRKIDGGRKAYVGGYHVITREDLEADLRVANERWFMLHASAKKWEKELLSRTWRV